MDKIRLNISPRKPKVKTNFSKISSMINITLNPHPTALRAHSNREGTKEKMETKREIDHFSTPGSGLAYARRPHSVRKHRCFGSVELLVSVDESGKIKNVGRFRVEPGPNPSVKENEQESAPPKTPVIIENPQSETRWYYRFFLGQDHQNFAGIDPHTKSPFFFSVLVCEEPEGTCIRAIQWIKIGSRKLSLPVQVPFKSLTAKSILQKFAGMSDFNGSLKEIFNPKLQKDLGILEDQEGSINFKFGVVFAKNNQNSDDEMLSNKTGDYDFEEFLKLLGHKINLKDWGNFKGGLDTTTNSTGKTSIYTTFGGHEIMFHVSTLLPHSDDNRQQVEKKRHIGNDIVNIIFCSGGDPSRPRFNPSVMKSHFTHIFALVTFDASNSSYRLWIFSEESVPAFGPTLPTSGVFYKAQDFREFLLTKLINGERAAFNAQALGEKRERTNDTLMKDMYMEYLKESHKHGFHRTADPLIRFRRSPKSKEYPDHDAIEFVKLGELLKLEKMLSGEAPYTSAADATLFRKQPWEPKLLSSNHEVLDVVSSDSWGKHSLLIATEKFGVVLLNQSVLSTVVEDEAKVQQVSVVEPFGFVLLRCEKGKEGFIAAFPLALVQRAFRIQNAISKKESQSAKIPGTKGCHLFGVTDCHNLRHSLAVCIGKKILLFRWALGHFGRVLEDANISKNFTLLNEITMNDEVSSIFVFEFGFLSSVKTCAATKHSVELVDFSKSTVSTLCKLDDTKMTIDSVTAVTEADSVEIVISYGNTTVIVDPEEAHQDYLKLLWTSKPESVAYLFPFIFAFAQNSMEVRLAVNGSLLATNYLPGVKLLASKEQIIFAAEEIQPGFRNRSWSLFRIRKKNRAVNNSDSRATNPAGSRTPNLTVRNQGSRVSYDGRMDEENQSLLQPKPLDSRIAALQLDGVMIRGGSLGSQDSGVGKSRQTSSTSSAPDGSFPESPNFFHGDPFGDVML